MLILFTTKDNFLIYKTKNTIRAREVFKTLTDANTKFNMLEEDEFGNTKRITIEQILRYEARISYNNSCPYCKINFNTNKWAKPTNPNHICQNCKNANERMLNERSANTQL